MYITQTLLFLSIASNLIAFAIYIRAILKNKIKPHAFTYLIWSLILSINLIAQIISGVGVGSILVATNLFCCIFIFLYSLKKGYTQYDKIDTLCLALAIFAILLWLLTKTPLYSVILSCVIDLLAFLPSFRKSFYKPYEDSAITFYVSSFEWLFSLPIYKVFSFIILAYPITILSLDTIYATMILIRRRLLHSKT